VTTRATKDEYLVLFSKTHCGGVIASNHDETMLAERLDGLKLGDVLRVGLLAGLAMNPTACAKHITSSGN
jgi:hypothetical protein